MKVYLAGKITKNGWRHSIFKGLRNHEHDNTYNSRYFKQDKPMKVDGCEYVGPFFLSDDHGMFHGEGTHGRGIGKRREHMMNQDWKIERREAVVDQCLAWINKCDKVFVWLDSEDALGTITEIGYAKALGKPIFIGVDAKLKGSKFEKDSWFAIYTAYELVHCDNAKEAWDIFVGEKKKVEVEKATEAQVSYIRHLSKEKGKLPMMSLDDITKEIAGRMIAYLQSGKFKEEMESTFIEMTGEQKEQLEMEVPKYKATEVVKQIKEYFADQPDFKFSTQKHAKYVKTYQAKENNKWAKTVTSERYGSSTTYYSKLWIEYLKERLTKEELKA